MGCCSHPLALACAGRGCYITLKQCYRVLHGCSRCESQQQQVQLPPLTPSRLAATPHKFNLWPLEHQLNFFFYHYQNCGCSSDYECRQQMELLDTSIQAWNITYNYNRNCRQWSKITTLPRLFSEHLLQIATDYECTHQKELFDTNLVQFGRACITGFRLENGTYKRRLGVYTFACCEDRREELWPLQSFCWRCSGLSCRSLIVFLLHQHLG